MESTGKYWIPVYNILENHCTIVLAHPKYVKAIRKKKIDKKDTKWIADLFKYNLIAESFMSPTDIRQLCDLMRCRFKRFPIFNWDTLSRTPSANLLRRYWINFSKILQILPFFLNPLFIKI